MADQTTQVASLSAAKRALLQRRLAQKGAAPKLAARSDQSEAPLSYAQQRFWFLQQLSPESSLYNVPRFVKLTGSLDIALLEQSLRAIVRRHQVLRCSYHMEEAGLRQHIHDEVELSLRVTDLRGTETAESVAELALEEYRRPFDLSRAPMLRCSLWLVQPQEAYLLLTMHHIASDGWTGGVLFDELGKHYRAARTGTAVELSPLPIQYADYAAWQTQLVEGSLQSQVEFWSKALHAPPPLLPLPYDHETPDGASYRGQVAGCQLQPQTAARLNQLARSQGMTLLPVLLAALRALLHQWTGVNDFVVGTLSANRSHTEIEPLIGCFMNFLALRGQVTAQMTAASLLATEKQTVLDAFANQELPFDHVVAAVNPERSLSANPLFNVALLLQNYPEFAFQADGLRASFEPLDTQVAFLDLRFLVTETSSGVLIECESNAERFEASTGDMLLQSYVALLEQIVANPDSTVGALALPDALQRHTLLRAQLQRPLCVAASYTADPILEPLRFWTKALGLRSEIQFAPFGQVYQQLLDPTGLLGRNRGGTNLLLLRAEDLLAPSDKDGSIEAAASQLVDALHTASAYAPLLVFFTPASSAVAATPAAMERCITLERTVMSRVENLPGLAAWSSATLQALYPVEMYEDTYAWQVGKIPYTSSMFAAMATFVARKLYNTHRSQRDVVLVAGEGRLWGCAATDPKLVRVLLEQAQRGILLTACDTQVSTPDGTPPSIASEELSWDYFSSAQFGMSPEQALQQISNELAIPPTRFLVLETDAKRCVRLEQQFAGLATVNMTMDQSWEDSWLLDPAVTLATLPFPQESKVQRRIQTELRTLDAIVEAVAHDRTPGSNEGNALQHIAPRTATETIVAAIWSQVLRQPQPSVDSNFFRLGGNSLLGVQVLSRIRQEASVELPLRAIFEAPTIAALAQRIDTLQRASASSLLPPLVAQSRPERTPASYAQQRLWFIDQLEPGNPIYNIPQRMRLRGPLDTLALQRSLSAVVHRHESLRTTFESDEGELAQVVNPARPVPLPVTDLSALTSPQLEEEAERYAQAEARQPFDLTRDLMLRAHLLRLAPQEHILLVVLHHIAGDRWSAGLLAEELEHLYAAYVQGTEPRLPELQVQYADYALWQRSWLHGEAMARQAAYWKEALAGAPALLELPTDKPRPATLQHAGGVTSIHLPPSLIEALNAVSVAHETTLFMTMLAALHVLLGRYARQDDVVIGTPIAGRNTTAAESMIGFFVNTLALRGTLGGNPSFSELLQRTRETVLNAYANQDVPFERVVEEVQPERSLSYQPLFQVMFALQNAPQQALQLAGLSLHREPLHQGTSAYDLSWFAIQVEDGMVLRLEFATSLFEQATIERMLRHYEVILLAAATAPSTRILELPLLPPSEQEWLRAVSNGPEITLPAVTSLHSMVEQQAARTPNAIACIDGTQSWSYRELNERANRIAHSLIQRGAGSEVLIGVYCERGFTLLVSILGVLKSGSAYVPLDPMYPQERIANILQDAKAPLVVTQQRLAAQLPHFAGELFFVDDDYNYQTQPNDNPKSGVQPENLAYVLFTSGSTGRPKGVALEHRSAIVFVVWALGVFTQRELAGVLFSTSVCFDLSVFEMFVPLSAGGTVILVENALHLPQLPARHQVTLINTVPSAIAELLRVEGVPATTLTVNLAGEALPDDLVEKIYTTTAVERVYNLYGPTEDTTYSTYTLVQRGELVTIGKPLAGTQAYVLDEQLAPVPIGVPGELYLAGAGLARGYYGRGDLTAERFLRVPASLATAGRMYKTSDLCRWLPDGRLQYLGRADHQVKIRGYRIELGEVELAMQQHPTIAQCVAVAREDNETKRLVAYVTVREAGVDANELRDSVRRTLPDYMVPAAVVILDSFPLTPNGKIDRKRLPAPEFGSSAAQAFVAPRNDMEATLASIWQEVLQLSSVSIHDNFFDIGGHSLLATRFLSRLRKQFAIDLPLLTLFESATIAELAREVQSRVADTNAVDEITPVERTAGLPLSFAQQRMWFLEQLVPGTPVHNIPNALRLRNALDVQSLRTALRMVLTRQEALRSTFSSHQGRPSVTVLQEAEPWLEWIDLTSHPEEDRWQLALQRVEQQAQTPIDLQHGPLLRTLVVSLGPHDHIVLFNIHHIVSDRWSISILVREVLSAYVALSSATPPVLPPLPSQYVDYAAWQQCFASTPDFEQQLHYWLAELKDAPPLLELPTDRPRTATNAPVGGEVRFSLSPALTDALHRLSQVSGATLFMTLLTGFQVLLARHSGQDDVVTG
ncbi:MAG: amino acid adenylation domain-containing protein, partial [Acidobacteriota bacterium]|nr:amino acid adenylation domain-containing protein [Acidobacteriota bacterium]